MIIIDDKFNEELNEFNSEKIANEIVKTIYKKKAITLKPVILCRQCECWDADDLLCSQGNLTGKVTAEDFCSRPEKKS